MGVDGLHSQWKRGYTSGYARKEELFWQMPWTLQEWTCACCSEAIVWTRCKCRRCSSAIPAGLQKKHLLARSESQARCGWQGRSSRPPSGYGENKILALSESSSTGHRAPRAAWRSQEAQKRPPSFFIGEVRGATNGSKSGGRCPHGTRGRNGQEKIQLDAQNKCSGHVIRAVGGFKGMDENVERMQAEIWQRELESIAKKKEEQVQLRPSGLR